MDIDVLLVENLCGAMYVKHDADSMLVYAWHGGSYVNVYNYNGDNVDCWSRQSWEGVHEVADSIAEHMAE